MMIAGSDFGTNPKKHGTPNKLLYVKKISLIGRMIMKTHSQLMYNFF